STDRAPEHAVSMHRMLVRRTHASAADRVAIGVATRARQGLLGTTIAGLASGPPAYRPLLLPLRLAPRAPLGACCRDTQEARGRRPHLPPTARQDASPPCGDARRPVAELRMLNRSADHGVAGTAPRLGRSCRVGDR